MVMILAHPVAVRAEDTVTRDLIATYHPLAVAQVICPRSTFLRFARRILRDAQFPILPVCPTQECGR